jgi:hypothetical protein
MDIVKSRKRHCGHTAAGLLSVEGALPVVGASVNVATTSPNPHSFCPGLVTWDNLVFAGFWGLTILGDVFGGVPLSNHHSSIKSLSPPKSLLQL